MTPVFLQIGLGFSPFHAGLMMIPMVLGSMGMKRIVVQVVNRFGYRRVLVATTLGLSLVTLLFMTTALLGWYYVLPFVLFFTRNGQLNAFLLHEHPDAERSPGQSGEQRKQPAVDDYAIVDEYRRHYRRAVAGTFWFTACQRRQRHHTNRLYVHRLSMALIIALPAFIFARVPNDTHQNVAISRRKRERAMKFWRPGITGKLFLAIFATCIVLLISMHWAVRISFERGFIDYIKHGNEQRLQLLSDALGEQYAQHGNWRFLRNNDRFVFQILRSFEHDNSEDKPGPGMPPHGWRTQFWSG